MCFLDVSRAFLLRKLNTMPYGAHTARLHVEKITKNTKIQKNQAKSMISRLRGPVRIVYSWLEPNLYFGPWEGGRESLPKLLLEMCLLDVFRAFLLRKLNLKPCGPRRNAVANHNGFSNSQCCTVM